LRTAEELPPKNKKKYFPGPYILYPLLRCKQLGESLVGSLCGPEGHPVRIYRHNEAKRNPMKGSIFGRVFNANALETAVLDVLKNILSDWPDLEPRLLSHVQKQIALAGRDDAMLAGKREHRQEVKDQLLLFTRTLTKKTPDDIMPEINRLEAERDSIDSEIDCIVKQSKMGALDAHAVTASLRDRLNDLAEEVPNLPPVALMDVLAQLTSCLEADMETKNVVFAFHFPAWMLSADAKTPIAALCATARSEFSTGSGTQRDSDLFVPLGDGECRFVRHRRSVTCHCSRQYAPEAA
jgi:uncharacterized protein (UPF0335 family)